MTVKAYEFSTKVTPDGKILIPDTYAKIMPIDDAVRVIVLVNESETSESKAEFPTLARIIAEIKNTPSNSTNIQPASGQLAEHLADSPNDPDPFFNVNIWNEEWDKVEAELEETEIVHERSEWDG